MHIKNLFISLEVDKVKDVFTNKTCPHVGIFHLYGGTELQENLVHPITIPDITNTGHLLKVCVGHGPTGRFSVKNVSDPAQKLEFWYKHSGRSKKNLKPGEVITSPETHLLIWDSFNLQGKLVTVTLTLIPLTHIHGLRLLFTTQTK